MAERWDRRRTGVRCADLFTLISFSENGHLSVSASTPDARPKKTCEGGRLCGSYFFQTISQRAVKPRPHRSAEAEAANKKPRNAVRSPRSRGEAALGRIGNTFECWKGPSNLDVKRMGTPASREESAKTDVSAASVNSSRKYSRRSGVRLAANFNTVNSTERTFLRRHVSGVILVLGAADFQRRVAESGLASGRSLFTA